MKNEKFSLRKRAASFRYAWQGIVALVRDEHNARIHVVAAVAAVTLGFVLQLSPLEWVAVVGCIGAVLAAEAMNSAIEAVCDKVSPQPHELIKKTKDCAAAGVLFVAIAAAVVGAILFLPKLIALLS